MSQYTVYDNIEKIYKRTNKVYFCMAVNHLMDKGFEAVNKITNEQIDAIKYEPKNEPGKIDMMNEDFIKWIWRTAKDIAEACEYQPSALIQFCQAVDLYDTYHFNGKLNKNRMEEMLIERISAENDTLHDKEGVRVLCEKYECEAVEFEALGFEVTEDYYIDEEFV